ncbi:hypothetical protein [Nitrincola nitratireducens]|uniref:Uncharacterized protein n=1 Tax=Nitrincola nitratireducens TaxID=1229521 RepID=W9UVC1_9GAMM|nr:hypothetical protein [Nitrincola nitratireducens]EXJ11029.1 hypothetical protein D791_02127 [Nitrincola nitratireducens]
MDKKSLTERDICTKFINPALEQAGWDLNTQVREEVSFTAGRIIVRGRLQSKKPSPTPTTSHNIHKDNFTKTLALPASFKDD